MAGPPSIVHSAPPASAVPLGELLRDATHETSAPKDQSVVSGDGKSLQNLARSESLMSYRLRNGIARSEAGSTRVGQSAHGGVKEPEAAEFDDEETSVGEPSTMSKDREAEDVDDVHSATELEEEDEIHPDDSASVVGHRLRMETFPASVRAAQARQSTPLTGHRSPILPSNASQQPFVLQPPVVIRPQGGSQLEETQSEVLHHIDHSLGNRRARYSDRATESGLEESYGTRPLSMPQGSRQPSIGTPFGSSTGMPVRRRQSDASQEPDFEPTSRPASRLTSRAASEYGPELEHEPEPIEETPPSESEGAIRELGEKLAQLTEMLRKLQSSVRRQEKEIQEGWDRLTKPIRERSPAYERGPAYDRAYWPDRSVFRGWEGAAIGVGVGAAVAVGVGAAVTVGMVAWPVVAVAAVPIVAGLGAYAVYKGIKGLARWWNGRDQSRAERNVEQREVRDAGADERLDESQDSSDTIEAPLLSPTGAPDGSRRAGEGLRSRRTYA